MSNQVDEALISAIIFNCSGDRPVVVHSCTHLHYFGFLTRKAIGQFLTFASREIVGRTEKLQRSAIKYTVEGTDVETVCYTYIDTDGVGCAVIAGGKYNLRVAASLTNILIEAARSDTHDRILSVTEDTNLAMPEVDKQFERYNDPKEADTILKITADLEVIKGMVIQNINQLLVNGEKLEDLVQRSTDLSKQSKLMFDQSKGMNKWCCWLI
eukprot:TRINITY_DN9403_c0_g1_i1.p1 TRINITY_DN9403_c0_g1~~TRINITY_DN9403_c0_g1_i1.p1  ORF type:complete len:212 (-),score=40.18 TRINITY_DN9403_c0_g1_i1:17-652(-)